MLADDKKRLIIEWDGDSAMFEIKMEGPSPLQVFTACHFMALEAESKVMRQLTTSPLDPGILPLPQRGR